MYNQRHHANRQQIGFKRLMGGHVKMGVATLKRLLIILIIASAASSSMAQSGTSVGIGEAYTALARGSEAIYWNPANLGFQNEGLPRISMSLYGLSVNLGNNSITRKLYDTYFTDENKVLSSQDITTILDAIPAAGLEGHFGSDVTILSIAMKNVGFGLSSSAIGTITAPKSAFEIPLQSIGQNNYDWTPKLDMEQVTRLNVAFGHVVARNINPIFYQGLLFREISVGINVAYLMGGGVLRTEHASFKTSVTDEGIMAKGSYTIKGTESPTGAVLGDGLGVDLAIAAKTKKQYTLALVFKNIYHKINWNRNTREYWGDLDTGDPKFLLGTGQLQDLDKDEVLKQYEKDIPGFSSRRKIDYRIAIGRTVQRYLYAAEIGSQQQRFLLAVGAGIRWSFVHVFSSYRYHRDHNLSLGVGLGGKNFVFDLGMGWYGGIIPGSYKGLVFGNSLRFGF